MKKEEYQLHKEVIPIVQLFSLTEKTWNDYNGNGVSWVDGDVIFPQIGDIVHNINVSDILVEGYYIWVDGTTGWTTTNDVYVTNNSYVYINNVKYYQAYKNYDFNVPIFLDETIKDLGVMMEFDGNVSQVEQKCNFTYSGNGNTVTVYNTVNTNMVTSLVNSIFTIYWGDTTSSTLSMTQIGDSNLPYISHTYTSGGTYTITVTVISPWIVEQVVKEITIPFTTPLPPTNFGELTFTIPYVTPATTINQEYLESYPSTTGNTDPTTGVTISFLALGKSRIDELKNYGESTIYSGITTGHTDAGDFTGYTIDDLFYMDYIDGYTHITGNTNSYVVEELYNGKLTRNEHFIGFIEDPVIYSDIFVERGKQGVMEKNFRLSEIESTGELSIYGNGYFTVRKQ